MLSTFALPIHGEIWICVRDERGTSPLSPVSDLTPVGASAPAALEQPGRHVTVGGHGYVAIRPAEGNELRVLRLDAGEIEATPVEIEVPDDMESVEAVHFCGDVVFVGGMSTTNPGSRLGWCDLNADAPSWNPLELEEIVGSGDRPICDILQDGDRLIVIDAAFTPKLALFFDVSSPKAPKIEGYARIPSGINDDIVNGDVGRAHVGILSSSHHDEGKAWKIGLYDREMMDEVTTVYEHADWSTPLEIPSSIAMLDDLVLIAHGSHGLGVLRLEDREASRYEHIPGVQPWSNPYVPMEKIEHFPPLGQGRVVDVITTGDPQSVYIVVKRGKNVWWEEVHLVEDEELMPRITGIQPLVAP